MISNFFSYAFQSEFLKKGLVVSRENYTNCLYTKDIPLNTVFV